MISTKETNDNNEKKYKELMEENNKLIALNKKLASENFLLKQKNKAKNSFLANISHEIRNPLYAILGFSELILNSGSLDKELCENIGYIFRCSEMLLELLNDLLDLSKVEAGKMDVYIAKADIGEIVDNIHNINKGHLVNKGLYFKSDLGGISEIETDAKRLNQILFNLVSNAIKFTEEGGIEIGLLEKEKSYYFFYKRYWYWANPLKNALRYLKLTSLFTREILDKYQEAVLVFPYAVSLSSFWEARYG